MKIKCSKKPIDDLQTFRKVKYVNSQFGQSNVPFTYFIEKHIFKFTINNHKTILS
ncbi:hypothetical protein IMSAGC014_01300 [Bacteroidaceae bacterium]|nr:hypothetical protein IMSAGC014_01300 [Bacteroidaceae bacterium]